MRRRRQQTPSGGAGGLIRGRSVQSQPSEGSIQPRCNKNIIIERSPPPTTTYYTNNTLSFCLLMIYFLNIFHTLDLISLLLKCKLGSLPLPQIVSHKWTFAYWRGSAERRGFLCKAAFKSPAADQQWTKRSSCETDLHGVWVLQLELLQTFLQVLHLAFQLQFVF